MDLTSLPLVLFDFLVWKLLPFLFVLTIVVFFHELGHFLVGRWNKVKAEVFAVGFGPELFGFTDRYNTRWKFCAVPLGGYVKFAGDGNVASQPDPDALEQMSQSEREGTLEGAALWRRALIVAAGPIANFILAIVIYTALFMVHDDVQRVPVVGEIAAGSPAQEAGFQPEDLIVELNGDAITSFRQISEATMLNSGEAMNFVVERAGERIELVATPRLVDQEDRFGNSFKVAQIGVRSKTGEEYLRVTSLGPVDAFNKAVGSTGLVVKGTFNFLREMILGKQSATELRGPLGIGQVTSQVATLGFAELMSLAAVISVSIGLLNLFPIPMLDGGHLVFYAIEAVRGKAVSPAVMEWSFKVGLGCLLFMMLFATTNDIGRLLPGG
ncbi:RIP metalloprotease RseP [Pseudahrensia aquimaris]|uniref:Zinc metalloprotease n=1 Tax=Pseudahrensia aquimaris TaxID=744461 RepID=A0ABW3FJS9_9HYPH